LANLTLNDVTYRKTTPNHTKSTEVNHTAEQKQATENPTERVALYVNRLKPQGMFMALAVRDPGSCSTLRRVHIFHQVCRQFTHELVFYPRLVPTDDTVTSWVQGRCVSGAVQQFPVPLPKLSCQPDGKWVIRDSQALGNNLLTGFITQEAEIWQASCVCDIGFGIVGDTTSGNQSCENIHASNAFDQMSYGVPFIREVLHKQCGWIQERLDGIESEMYDADLATCCLKVQTLVIGLALGKTYTMTVTSRNDLSDIFPKTALEDSSTSVTFTLPEEIPVTVDALQMETIERTQFNTSFASLDLQHPRDERTQTRNQSEGQTMIRVTWKPPAQNDLSLAETETWVGMPEYQVYVWMQRANHPIMSEVTGGPIRPVLVHFLSDTVLHFADLPNQATIKVWVRPRTPRGWGTFTKTTFHYPPSVNDEGGIKWPSKVTETDPAFYSADASDSASDTQTDRGSAKIIWLSLLLAFALILLVALFVFLKLRKRTFLRRGSSLNHMEPEKSGEPQPLMTSAGVIDESKVLEDLRFDDEPNSPATDEQDVKDATSGNLSGHSSKNGLSNGHNTKSNVTREIDPKQLKIDKTIGEGEFGEVCSGVLGSNCLVAVKMLRLDVPDKAKQDFLKEGPGQNTELSGLMQMLLDICEGMKFISAQGYVHRDLAARNILLDAKNRCKISDFGLARKIGENSEDDDAYTLKITELEWRFLFDETDL
uniref:Protein kinase domain-containing protein n=1 Tax=Echinostoma caproni TaxID=27848 RepID=A0A183A9Y9_9TREM